MKIKNSVVSLLAFISMTFLGSSLIFANSNGSGGDPDSIGTLRCAGTSGFSVVLSTASIGVANSVYGTVVNNFNTAAIACRRMVISNFDENHCIGYWMNTIAKDPVELVLKRLPNQKLVAIAKRLDSGRMNATAQCTLQP